jgi:hypothetical protein
MPNTNLIQEILNFSTEIRYVAIYQRGQLSSKRRESLEGSSSDESDRHEELIVNPAVLLLLRQRGTIDCGGLNHVVIRYGSFAQVVKEIAGGHISLCIESTADIEGIAAEVFAHFEQAAQQSRQKMNPEVIRMRELFAGIR